MDYVCNPLHKTTAALLCSNSGPKTTPEQTTTTYSIVPYPFYIIYRFKTTRARAEAYLQYIAWLLRLALCDRVRASLGAWVATNTSESRCYFTQPPKYIQHALIGHSLLSAWVKPEIPRCPTENLRKEMLFFSYAFHQHTQPTTV